MAASGHWRPLEASKRPFISLKRKGYFVTLNWARNLILFLFDRYLLNLTAKHYPRTSL